MISKETEAELERDGWPYILGARLRQGDAAMERVLADDGPFEEVFPKAKGSKAPSPLRVKDVRIGERRYVVCLNVDQATKDRHDREAIVAALEGALKQGDKSLIGNKGFKRYVAESGKNFSIDSEKVKEEARYDGLWVLDTNTELPAREVALKYKQLWMVEDAFRSMKSLLETRPIWHKCDETIIEAVHWDEEDDEGRAEEAGTISYSLVKVGLLRNDGANFFDFFDSEGWLYEIGECLFDWETHDLKEEITGVIDEPLGSNLLVIHDLQLLPAFRGKRLGLAILKCLIDEYADSCGFAFLNIYLLRNYQ